MSKYNNYILTIDPNSNYDMDLLKEQLDLCIDWTRLYACNYILNTTSDLNKLYNRFKLALPEHKFFIANLNLYKDDYTGWLKSTTWKRIKEFKNKN